MFNISPDILIGILIGLVVILCVLVVRLEIRLNRIFRGKKGNDLEDSINNLNKEVIEFNEFKKEMGSYINVLEKRVSRSAQAVATKRYNPFKGTGEGGNNSSSTAILSEKGDGVVLTTLYARERMSVFVKQIEKFVGTIGELTPEEKSAIEEAKEKLK